MTILPGYVMGPPLRKEHVAYSSFCRRLMTGKIDVIPCSGCAIVDVRDVGLAHLKAIQVTEAANKRFILVNYTARFIEYAQPIIDKYVPLGWPKCQN